MKQKLIGIPVDLLALIASGLVVSCLIANEELRAAGVVSTFL